MNSYKISIVIPVYNEQERLLQSLEMLEEFFKNFKYNYEIIFVNDGSTDSSLQILQNYKPDEKINYRIIDLPKNLGKGGAVNAGILDARGEIVGFMDADISYNLRHIEEVIDFLKKEEVDVVIGGRDFPESTQIQKPPLLRRISGKVLSYIVFPFTPNIRDTQCGFKFFKNSVSKNIFNLVTIKDYGFDIEVLLIAKKKRYQIKRIPVELTHSENSKVRVIRDSLNILYDLILITWNCLRGKYK